MCDCVNDIEARLLENVKASGRHKKPVLSVSLKGVGFPIVRGELQVRTCSTIEVTLDGQKKKDEVSLFHVFCPFCGEKYGEDAAGG